MVVTHSYSLPRVVWGGVGLDWVVVVGVVVAVAVAVAAAAAAVVVVVVRVRVRVRARVRVKVKVKVRVVVVAAAAAAVVVVVVPANWWVCPAYMVCRALEVSNLCAGLVFCDFVFDIFWRQLPLSVPKVCEGFAFLSVFCFLHLH